jgi:CheY-like chemotaxis protein
VLNERLAGHRFFGCGLRLLLRHSRRHKQDKSRGQSERAKRFLNHYAVPFQGEFRQYLRCTEYANACPDFGARTAGACRGEGNTMSVDAPSEVSVLVVDDDHDTRKLLELVLQRHVQQIRLAESVETAIEAFEEAPPDLVITDVAMPGYNGYALVTSIREHDEDAGRRTPVIALTAYTSPADRETALNSGFDAYLEKPFSPEELLETMGSLLGKTLA